jgi:uncharacterized membrane protein
MTFNKKQIVLTSFIIFCLNLCLKLIDIGNSSFWYDEIISCNDTLLDFGHIKHEAEWDKNPPFYHYLLWIWSKFFGISEIGLRSMSAFFSALTGVVLFILTTRLFNGLTGLFVSLIFILHPYLFYYSQEARCYSLLIFLISINLGLTIKFIKNNSILLILLLGISNFLIFYTHYIAGLILLCQFVFLLLILKGNYLKIFSIYGITILLVLLRFTKKQYKVLFMSHEMSSIKKNVPLSNFFDLFRAIDDLFITNLLAILLVIALIYKLITILTTKEQLSLKTKIELYIILSPWVCLFILYFVGLLTNVFNERYLIFITPFILISIACLINHRFSLTILTVGILSYSIFHIEFGKSRQMDYRQAAMITKLLKTNRNIDIYLQTHDISSLFCYYYLPKKYPQKIWNNKTALKEEHIYIVENNYELNEILPTKGQPILLFQTFDSEKENLSMAVTFKTKGYHLLMKRKVSDNITMTVLN